VVLIIMLIIITLSLLAIICAFLVPTIFSIVLCIITALLWFINGILEVRSYHRRKNNVI
jgi:hypothetical protein